MGVEDANVACEKPALAIVHGIALCMTARRVGTDVKGFKTEFSDVRLFFIFMFADLTIFPQRL